MGRVAKTLKVVPIVPDAELSICRRLREARLLRKWSQPNLSRALGITRERLASIEYGRAPLRFDVALKLWNSLDLNQRWLAEGKEPRDSNVPIADELLAAIPKQMLFSEAYEKYLKRTVENLLQSSASETRTGYKLEHVPGIPLKDRFLQHCIRTVGATFHRLPPTLYQEFYDLLFKTTGDFDKRHQKEIDRYFRSLKNKTD